MINKEKLLQELCNLYKDIGGPFPYKDLRKMRKTKKLASHFENLGDDDWLSADLNTYFMTVHGLASRILEGNMKEAPTTALQWLTTGDFFALFPKYHFLEDEWKHFPQFASMYENTKRMQKIVLLFFLADLPERP